jgi:hypothetical protein
VALTGEKKKLYVTSPMPESVPLPGEKYFCLTTGRMVREMMF